MPLSSIEKEKIIAQARANLPELDRRFAAAMHNLQRISEGKMPKSN